MASRKTWQRLQGLALSAVSLVGIGGGGQWRQRRLQLEWRPCHDDLLAQRHNGSRQGVLGQHGRSVPGVITTGVLAFTASWNSYLLPLFILNNQDTFTLPLGVQAFASPYSVDTAKVLAFTSLSMIPALVFFSLFERRIVGGLTGAVKAELPGSAGGDPNPVETWTRARAASG